MEILEQVSEFHRLFQHPILTNPQIPNEQRCALRKSLLQEELAELCEAIDKKDIVGVADALCDLQYVLAGAVLEFGMKDAFPKMFAEVQRSNMSKACDTEQEAKDTIQFYQNDQADRKKRLQLPDPIDEMHYEERGGKFFVYRTHDMKTLKSINYSPADLKKILSL